jgi:sarcosine oxidase/L-pipecolate oxidase
MYLTLTAAEQERLGRMPVLMNVSSGLFIIPPSNRLLKVARHAYGYSNPVTIPDPDGSGTSITVSLPRTSYNDPHLVVPPEGERACRAALREMIPELGDRPFEKGRICWYTDTPTEDFLITYHPKWEGLFLATGGSGHGYKFLPVIGERIVDCVEGNCPVEFRDKWAWPERIDGEAIPEDGRRGGKWGMVLEEEMGMGVSFS